MNSDGNARHLTPQEIQELLDHGLAPREEARVRGHLASCPSCQEEAASWNVLFSRLESLPELAPGPELTGRVLQALPARRPWWSRVTPSWLPGKSAKGLAGRHLPPETIQDYLEGVLGRRRSARAEAHLAACASCAAEVRSWTEVFGSLNGLVRHRPAPGFAERVMDRVHVPSPLPVASGEAPLRKVLAWARSALPQTRRGWAVAGGIASAPTVTLTALLYLVFSHPLLSLGTFWTYASWKLSGFLGSAFSALSGALLESVAVFRAYALVETLMGSPVLIGMGGLAFSLLSAAALWVLYRNLITTPSGEGHHARVRV